MSTHIRRVTADTIREVKNGMKGFSKGELVKTIAITLALIAIAATALGIWALLSQEEQIQDAQYVNAYAYEEKEAFADCTGRAV